MTPYGVYESHSNMFLLVITREGDGQKNNILAHFLGALSCWQSWQFDEDELHTVVTVISGEARCWEARYDKNSLIM